MPIRHDALDYVNGCSGNVSCGVRLCLCHSYSFFSDFFFFFSYDYLGFWRFPPVCTVNYAVTLVLVIISGGSVSDSLGAKSHLLDVFVLLADINSPLFDYK
jgi:hypothetical protein